MSIVPVAWSRGEVLPTARGRSGCACPVIALLVACLVVMGGVAAAAGGRIMADDDFEQGLQQSETTDVYGEVTGHQLMGPRYPVRVMVPGVDASGRAGAFLDDRPGTPSSRCLRLQNGPGMGRDLLPGLCWWLHGGDVVRSGTLHMSFEFLLPQAPAGVLELHVRHFGVDEALALTFSRDTVQWPGHRERLAAGEWTSCDITVPVGAETGTVRMTLQDPVQGIRHFDIQRPGPVDRIDWVGFLMPGEGTNFVLLDNLRMAVEDETAGPAVTPSRGEGTTPNQAWRAAPAVLLDVFPGSEAVADTSLGATTIASTYYPGGSSWGEGLDERWVFHREIHHRQDDANSYAVRVGLGGQLYSLRGAFGESLPPQGLDNPWNDEVWQFVSVCSKYNEALFRAKDVPDDLAGRLRGTNYSFWYFVHNSGAYIPGDSGLNNLYCPLLASTVLPDGRTTRTVNWGLVPQVRTVNRSPLLYYVQTRDAGDGVIEITYVVHNFSVRDDVVFDHLNAPWGGTRITSLPFHYVGSPDGALWDRARLRDEGFATGRDVRDTGGWNLSSVSDSDGSPSLALVYGRDRNLEREQERAARGEPFIQFAPSIYRDWIAGGGDSWRYQDWRSRPDNTHRNYEVAVVIPKFRLAPGTTIWYRSFLVVNSRSKAIEQAKALVDKVDYGLLVFDPATTPRVKVHIRGGKIVDTAADGAASFELFAQPVPGSMPLFLLEELSSGRQVVTTDPYLFVSRELLDIDLPPGHPLADYYRDAAGYDLGRHNTKWDRLLGYGLVKRPDEKGSRLLSDVAGAGLFPPVSTYHVDLWVKVQEGEGTYEN